jgi:uncharacterized protein
MAQMQDIRSKFGGPGYSSANAAYNDSLKMLGNDDAEAFRLTQIAADKEMHDAVLAMGWFYLNGIGVAANEEEAHRWYRKSARQGNEKAMFSLGQMAYWQQDFSDAMTWFNRAAGQGHHRSKFWIGKMYWRGEGVEQDQKTAQKMFAEAASKRVFEAQRAIRYLDYLRRH